MSKVGKKNILDAAASKFRYDMKSDDVETLHYDQTIVMSEESGLAPLSESILSDRIVQPHWNKLDSSFENLNVIGVGGMGTVFSAKDKLFFRNVALKIMRSELRNKNKYVESFIREARITAQIDHPNIVPVYNMGVFDGTGVYFSMKKVNGETLSDVLRKLSEKQEDYLLKYNLRQKLEIFLSICNGLAFAHYKGITHRDLKPGNIMIGKFGEVFIMDWGMAIYRSECDKSKENNKIELGKLDKPEKNKTGVVSGTPAFMSPEQIRGNINEIDSISDVYSLGVILYSILSCRQSPFRIDMPPEQILRKVLDGDITPLRKCQVKVSKELEAVCKKAMAVNRYERYQSVEDLMQDIKNVLDMHPVGVYNSLPVRFIKLCRRHPLIPTAFIGGCITLGVFFSYIFVSDYLNFQSLMKVAEINIGHAEELYGKVKISYQKNNSSRKISDWDFINRSELNDQTLALNKLKFKDYILTVLDDLSKLDQLTYKKNIKSEIDLILRYALGYCVMESDGTFLNVVIRKLNGNLKRQYQMLLAGDKVLRKKVNTILRDNGNLTLKSEYPVILKGEYYTEDFPYNRSPFDFGSTPFEQPLKSGIYLFQIKLENGKKISFPLKIVPGDDYVLNLNFPESIPEGMVYIPGGEYLSGISKLGDRGYTRYVGDFLMLNHEVTFGEYLEFWNDLKSPELRNRYRAKLIMDESDPKLENLWDGQGRLIKGFEPDMPVVGITSGAAEAYCEYISRKLNLKCRLPSYGELEKAARGADSRIYVWGDDANPENSLLQGNSQAKKYPYGAPKGSFETDKSCYGIYDLAGNVHELMKYSGGSGYGIYGGSYLNDIKAAKCGYFSSFNPLQKDVGFRYVAEIKNKQNSKEKND